MSSTKFPTTSKINSNHKKSSGAPSARWYSSRDKNLMLISLMPTQQKSHSARVAAPFQGVIFAPPHPTNHRASHSIASVLFPHHFSVMSHQSSDVTPPNPLPFNSVHTLSLTTDGVPSLKLESPALLSLFCTFPKRSPFFSITSALFCSLLGGRGSATPIETSIPFRGNS
jgi:hypothetical protein